MTIFDSFCTYISGSSDDTYGSFTNGSAVKLYDTGTASVIDDVDVGNSLPALPALDGQLDQSYERRFSGCQDTDDGKQHHEPEAADTGVCLVTAPQPLIH